MPPGLPKVRIDLTSDEVVVLQPAKKLVIHPYPDADDLTTPIGCYPIEELLAEKLRALSERCRPRDLYDVIHIHRHPDLVGRSTEVARVLERKCSHVGIGTPDAQMIQTSPYRDELEQE
jgi:predicted nucleotidyltransferase component of viral defense system